MNRIVFCFALVLMIVNVETILGIDASALTPENGNMRPGPFTYTMQTSLEPEGPVFDWVDISGYGTSTGTLPDDNFVPVTLPFLFPFFGKLNSSVNIGSNGYLTFRRDAIPWENTSLPTSTEPNNMIALYWDDLYPPFGGDIQYYYDEAYNRFIVQYSNIIKNGQTGTFTMQTILEANGNIILQYQNMIADSASATVGIEDSTGTIGYQYSYNQTNISNGLAIKFTYSGGYILDPPQYIQLFTLFNDMNFMFVRWSEVLGANSYKVYTSHKPHINNWDTNFYHTTDLYMQCGAPDEGTFYKVEASSDPIN